MVCARGSKLQDSCCFLGATSRICSKEHITFSRSSYLVFSQSVSLESWWCNHTAVVTWLQLGRNPTLFCLRDQIPVLWSYAGHVGECGGTTGHCTCGYFVRDYHISFRLFALSNPSMPTLCLKDQRRCVDNSARSSFDGQVM